MKDLANALLLYAVSLHYEKQRGKILRRCKKWVWREGAAFFIRNVLKDQLLR